MYNFQLILLGMVGMFAVLVSPAAMTISFASIQNDSSTDSTNDTILPNGSSTHFPIGPTLDHINQAQAALQNGDTEGANNHLELAKQTLEEYNRGEVKPVNPDIVITK